MSEAPKCFGNWDQRTWHKATCDACLYVSNCQEEYDAKLPDWAKEGASYKAAHPKPHLGANPGDFGCIGYWYHCPNKQRNNCKDAYQCHKTAQIGELHHMFGKYQKEPPEPKLKWPKLDMKCRGQWNSCTDRRKSGCFMTATCEYEAHHYRRIVLE
jgi:hypothetical protein